MTESKGKVLVVDDDPNALRVLSAILTEDGYHVYGSLDVEGAIKRLSNGGVDAVVTDLKMPVKDGMQLFGHLKEKYPEIPVIFLTAYGTVEGAVDVMGRGAFYYFIKPPDYRKLKGILARAVERRRLKREIELLRKKLSEGSRSYRIIGNSTGVKRVLGTIRAIKDSVSSVFISGETGTGKELVARVLHHSSVRQGKPFVAVNCAAVPKDLMESEFFGYEKGAFTGAISMRKGKIEEASEGTLFLDEISELEPSLQAKLLRVLQEREIERIGSSKRIQTDFRLVTSTNRELKTEVATGRFREDLFYRINVVEIRIPPLRERKEDIPLLVSEFACAYCVRDGKALSVPEEVMELFQGYHWPGNIRQLKNVIERAVVLARGDKITVQELPQELCHLVKGRGDPDLPCKTFKELEREAIQEALKTSGGNKSKAAKMLGISRKAFYKRLNDYCIAD